MSLLQGEPGRIQRALALIGGLMRVESEQSRDEPLDITTLLGGQQLLDFPKINPQQRSDVFLVLVQIFIKIAGSFSRFRTFAPLHFVDVGHF